MHQDLPGLACAILAAVGTQMALVESIEAQMDEMKAIVDRY